LRGKFNWFGDRVAPAAGLDPCWDQLIFMQGIPAMASAYYSTIFREPAPEIWKIIRDFNNYPVWVGGAGESEIEDGKSGDAVGAVRHVLYRGRHIRQRLLALSDAERSQAYEFCGEPTLPVTSFQARLRVTPVIDGDHAFVEWWADFDCEPARRDELVLTLRGWFAQWLESLRKTLSTGTGHEAVTNSNWRPSVDGSGPIRRVWP
jgi:Polyketide cyclase / dehydrase and lipid transport